MRYNQLAAHEPPHSEQEEPLAPSCVRVAYMAVGEDERGCPGNSREMTGYHLCGNVATLVLLK